MSRKNIVILINGKYKSGFISELIESQKTKKDFLVEIANEFISNENLNIDKIELPEVKRGRKAYGRTEEEKKEIKRRYQKEYYSKKKNDEEFMKKASRMSSEWQRNNCYHITIDFSIEHYDRIYSIIEPSGYTISGFFKLAIEEYIEENYIEENENAENLETKDEN